jgi:single-strand DNA-binding protein
MELRGTVNRVELIGWVGGDPEQRFIPSGAAVCSFSIATKRPGAKNEAGERAIDTDWTSIEAWERLGEQCKRYLHKGSRVRVVGSLHTQSWDDRETGQKRFKTVVRAEEVLFLDRPPETQDEPAAVEEVTEDLPF